MKNKALLLGALSLLAVGGMSTMMGAQDKEVIASAEPVVYEIELIEWYGDFYAGFGFKSEAELDFAFSSDFAYAKIAGTQNMCLRVGPVDNGLYRFNCYVGAALYRTTSEPIDIEWVSKAGETYLTATYTPSGEGGDVEPTAPSTPVGLVVSSVNDTTKVIAFAPSTGATSYKLYIVVKGTGEQVTGYYGLTIPNGYNLSIVDFEPATYTVYVSAVNDVGESGLSAGVDFTIAVVDPDQPIEPPATPVGLVLNNISDNPNAKVVAFAPSDGATSYKLYVTVKDTGEEVTGYYGLTIPNGYILSFADFEPGTYSVCVSAVNSGGESAKSATVDLVIEVNPGDAFIADWTAMRVEGGESGICTFINTARMNDLLARYDALNETDKAKVDAATDGDCTIGESVAYVKTLTNEMEESIPEKLSVNVEGQSMNLTLIVIIAVCALSAVGAYTFISKKRS